MKIFELTDQANNINWNCISQKDVSSVGCSSVCWNPSILDPQTLVVGCHYDQRKDNKSDLIQIYAYSDQKKEYTYMTNLTGHSDTVTDCQWAPQFGRSFHMIASCSLDRSLRIWRIDLTYEVNNEQFEGVSVRSKCIGEFQHDNPVS
jgi:WD40 repeat protein